MRVLHVSGDNLCGGAARGAYWLHRGLQTLGAESVFMIQGIRGRQPDVVCLAAGVRGSLASLWFSHWSKLRLLAYWRRTGIYTTGLKGFDLTTRPEYVAADIIHFHYISSGAVGLEMFRRIRKPIVWTFRDMWPFTGGCHYSLGCTNFLSGCGCCPLLGSHRHNDLSRYIFDKKRYNYRDNIFPVAISNWLKDTAASSPLFAGVPIKVIPNGIDVKAFSPVDRQEARRRLGLPPGMKIVVVGANDLRDGYKGFEKVVEVMRHLRGEGFFFLFFGRLPKTPLPVPTGEFRSMGYLEGIASLREVYSAGDVFLAASLQEAFGKTLAEAMACGTPVVAFDATGPRDIVVHQQTGYLAPPYDAAGLVEGIRWLTADRCRQAEQSGNARSRAVAEFAIDRVVGRYLSVYEEALAG